MYYEPVQRRLQFVLDKYGKRAKSDATLSFFSMANETFSFDCQDGERYFLKNCLKNNSPVLLQLEVDLARHLREHGMPTPEVVPDKHGNDIVKYRDQLYLMTRCFPGDTPTWADTLELWQLQESMRGLARFHRASASFDETRDSNRIKTFELERISDWLDSLQHALTSELKQRPERAVAQQMLDLLPRFRALLEENQPKIAALLADCQVQMIHGDFHCFNAFFDQHKLTGCCDFDFIRRDLRLFDIYWGMRIFVYNLYMRQAYGEAMWEKDFTPDPQKQQQMLADALHETVTCYREHYSLPDSELQHLVTVVRLLPLTVIQFFDLENSDEECAEHLEWFTWKLNSLDETCHALQLAVDQIIGA